VGVPKGLPFLINGRNTFLDGPIKKEPPEKIGRALIKNH
jgi:hypothetical protein